jgi:hypothetical protein
MKKISFIFVIALFITFSCYYDNEDDLYPVSDFNKCDTTGIIFSTHIMPAIQSKCNNCHSNALAPSLGGHIELENYENIKYSVDDGSFTGSINYNNGFSPMPPENKLDDCTISKIEAWINKGAIND